MTIIIKAILEKDMFSLPAFQPFEQCAVFFQAPAVFHIIYHTVVIPPACAVSRILYMYKSVPYTAQKAIPSVQK